MDLILWRHADAGVAGAGPELDRPLSEDGIKQAKQAAKWLKKHLPDNTQILVSPALRCQDTAKALTDKFETCEELAPDGTVAKLLLVAGWNSAAGASKTKSVLICGHQPTLGKTAALLVCKEQQDWHVRKGAIWWITTRDDDKTGKSEVVIQAVVRPKDV